MWPWCQRALTEAEWLRWAGANSLFRIDWWICAFSKPTTWATFISCFMYRKETACEWVRHIRSFLEAQNAQGPTLSDEIFLEDAVAWRGDNNGMFKRLLGSVLSTRSQDWPTAAHKTRDFAHFYLQNTSSHFWVPNCVTHPHLTVMWLQRWPGIEVTQNKLVAKVSGFWRSPFNMIL